MKKECKFTRFIRNNFLAMVIVGISIISFVLVYLLSGISGSSGEEKYYIDTLEIVFGNATMQVSKQEQTKIVALEGGMSIFGLCSIIALILADILAIVSIFVRNYALDYYAVVAIIVSGVLMLLLFNMGTMVTIEGNVMQFKHFVLRNSFKLGAGAIAYGITTIVGGAIGLFIEEKNLVR